MPATIHYHLLLNNIEFDLPTAYSMQPDMNSHSQKYVELTQIVEISMAQFSRIQIQTDLNYFASASMLHIEMGRRAR